MQIIPMSDKEIRIFEITKEVITGRLKQTEAADRLSVTDRTVRRWVERIEEQGAGGLVHGNRGKESPRKVPKEEYDRIASLIRTKYPDFGSALAAEKLKELHGIHRDQKTVWNIMVEEGLWIPRSKRKGAHSAAHRQWRERRAHRGSLIQFDGSYHDWFEGRGGITEACLLASIDDATGEVLHLWFAPHEGTLPVMAFWIEYAGIHGLPKQIYLDRFSTYKMTQRVAEENHDLKTQLQRAMKTLGVDLIFALSPQAKGRVERLFQTLQDRLVKELRLRNISNVEDANRFILKSFLPAFNRKFRVEPREKADFHRLLSHRELAILPLTLCRMEQRMVQHDFTVSFKSQWYQILPTKRLAIRPRDTVIVREYPDSTLSFSIRNIKVDIKPIAKRQECRRPTGYLIPTLVPV